ncbi:MAG: hypothetical protein GF334_10835 [Candidatus Altiarchaeales archaeon]|nr:hypothetical protein [Candidatus Altiarchaeales archaeon]
MLKRNKRDYGKIAVTLTAIAFIVLTVQADPAQKIANALCTIYCQVIIYVARPLATAVFIYGGVLYVYSADDPGGRKKAKSVCVNAIVGLIIIAVAKSAINTIASSFGGSVSCNCS